MNSTFFKSGFISIIAASTVATANAQEGGPGGYDPNDWHGFIAVGVVAAPDYEGSKQYRVLPFPFFSVSKGNYSIRTEGPGVAINIIDNANFNAGPIVAFRPERDEDARDATVKTLTTINSSVEAGGFLSYGFDLDGPGERIEASVKSVFDLGDAHNGYTVQGSLSYRTVFERKYSFSLALSATYGDEKYNNTYFGVSAADSAISGIAQYNAESGLKDIGATTTLGYQFDDKWGMMVIGGYTKLLSPAKDSPLIQAVGNTNQFFGGTAVTYRF